MFRFRITRTLAPVLQVLLYSTTVTTTARIAPGNDRSIAKDGSKSDFSGYDLLYSLQLTLHSTTVTTITTITPSHDGTITQNGSESDVSGLDLLHILQLTLHSTTDASIDWCACDLTDPKGSALGDYGASRARSCILLGPPGLTQVSRAALLHPTKPCAKTSTRDLKPPACAKRTTSGWSLVPTPKGRASRRLQSRRWAALERRVHGASELSSAWKEPCCCFWRRIGYAGGRAVVGAVAVPIGVLVEEEEAYVVTHWE